jgi:hypothetical protein
MPGGELGAGRHHHRGRAPRRARARTSGRRRPGGIATPEDDREYWYPQILPGGRDVLLTASYPERDAGDLLVLDLETGTRRVVQRDGVGGRYLRRP